MRIIGRPTLQLLAVPIAYHPPPPTGSHLAPRPFGTARARSYSISFPLATPSPRHLPTYVPKPQYLLRLRASGVDSEGKRLFRPMNRARVAVSTLILDVFAHPSLTPTETGLRTFDQTRPSYFCAQHIASFARSRCPSSNVQSESKRIGSCPPS